MFVNLLSLAARCTLHVARSPLSSLCIHVLSQRILLSATKRYFASKKCSLPCVVRNLWVFSCIYFSRIDSLQLFRLRLLTICNVHLPFLLFFAFLLVCIVVLRCLLFAFLIFAHVAHTRCMLISRLLATLCCCIAFMLLAYCFTVAALVNVVSFVVAL